jgi:hypothetical protein
MEMPIRAFWSFVGSVSRIRAEADQRQLSLLCSYQSKEGIKHIQKALQEELGDPIKFENKDEFDPAGWDLLKQMSKQKIGAP